MKKIISILVSIVLIFSTFTFSGAASTTETKPLLSEMSESECIAFIKENGISLPPLYEDEEDWGSFVQEYIRIFEENPNAPIAINYSVFANLASEIQTVVNNYYGVSNSNTDQSSLSLRVGYPFWLENSTVYSEWDSSFLTYNCYAFVIGETDKFYDPGVIYAREQGPDYFMSWFLGFQYFNVEEIRDEVVKDLEILGHTRIVSDTSDIYTDNLCTNESVICVRKGSKDYHFAKYTPDGWLHKPGNTQILKYNAEPNSVDMWTNEVVFMGIYYEPNRSYNSTIYFISYNGHNWNWASCGNGTHTKSCSICGDSFTYSCDYSYNYIGLDTHSGRCLVCDGAAPNGACDITVTNNGNGTHTRACSLCDNHYTVNCSLEYTNINNTRHSASCTICDYYVASESCSVSYTSRGNKTHTASCSQCKNTFTGNCSITYSYTSSNQHRGSCNKCSYTQTASCYYLTTYCGNSSLGDVHKTQCKTCGHVSGSATTACSLVLKSNGNNTHSNICTKCGYIKAGPTVCMFKSDNTCRFCGAMKNSAVINDLEDQETQ